MGYAIRNWVARKMRLYLDNVTVYYAQTEFQKQCFVAEGFAGDRISVIPNMVEKQIVKGINTLGNYVGYAGRISPEKGVSTLVKAASRCGDIPFKIAGDYDMLTNLVSTATGNVEFLGYLSKVTLEKVYKCARVFVMPSVCYEGFPSVLIEAMLHSKPVICSHIGGLPEIVEDGKTGLLFEPGNSEDLAEKINFVYQNIRLGSKMGKAGRAKVLREYSPERYYERLLAVYNTAIKLNTEVY